MTDRHAGYIVTLDHDIREDDAADIITALRNIKFVASVKPVIGDVITAVAASRRDREWQRALMNLAARGPDHG